MTTIFLALALCASPTQGRAHHPWVEFKRSVWEVEDGTKTTLIEYVRGNPKVLVTGSNYRWTYLVQTGPKVGWFDAVLKRVKDHLSE